MKASKMLAVPLSLATLLILQGCGGGDGGDKGGGDAPTLDPNVVTRSTTTVPTTATTTWPFPRTPPLSGEDAATYLNTLYRGYKEDDATSLPGVVMRTASAWGFFCDGFEGYTGCYMGFARCVTSASILNDRVMLNNGDQLFMGLKRSTGIMFNTSMVEKVLGRCTYQFDGTSWGRYNRGCGSVATNGEGFCEDKTSAWWNIDPATGAECTDESEVVLKDYCPEREKEGTDAIRKEDPPCFWKGPAFYSQKGFIESETHKMMEQRIANQGDYGDLVSTWNEVVLDAELRLTGCGETLPQ